MIPFVFGGQDFAILKEGAIFWPSQSALIVADLHLEKASWFAMRGQMLPPYDSAATLERLANLIVQTGASDVWCLGDNFHDDDGAARLSGGASALLARLTAGSRWHWITGNHDENLPDGIGGTILPEAELDGIVLRHRADALEHRPELSGHFHPKHRARARGQSVYRPCFVSTATKLILPAFGALTGGLAADHPEIRAAVGKDAAALLPAADRLLRFALAI
ncbi:ligase-associated DNA damage response endonuclease PdeM [Aquisediminimonas profunda]|uniref:ligase-associated DNA damage response endonuclease PdeM n=1 Tax=Aquisediminimonas profunda TaxID=1550733 RepID=UPI001C62CD23|nr:ligase-associated DNA damage response endonuclease PdeM [Aquisediminimonas profunda]